MSKLDDLEAATDRVPLWVLVFVVTAAGLGVVAAWFWWWCALLVDGRPGWALVVIVLGLAAIVATAVSAS